MTNNRHDVKKTIFSAVAMKNKILLTAGNPLNEWEGKVKGEQPHLNVPAPAPDKKTNWEGYVKIEEAKTYRIKVGADDYGSFTLGGQTSSLTEPGQYRESEPKEVYLEKGWHPASLSHTNIKYTPESGNVARFDSYLDDVQVVLYDIVPKKNKPIVCKKGCDGKEVCEDPDNPNGGTSSSSSPSSARMSLRLARSTVSGSSAGTNVSADATQASMYWQCNFGLFRGVPGVPGGLLEIVEEELTNRLWSPASLLFRHVMHSTLLKPTAGLSASCMVAVQKGSLLNYYFITQGEQDGGQVNNIGYNTSHGNRARMLGTDFTPVVSNPVYIEVTEAGGSKAAYSVETGDFVRFTTTSGQHLTPEDFASYMDVVYSEDGSLRQVSNISDGLANVQDVTETGYTLALYLPAQVGTKDEETGLYAVTGDPFKSFEFARHATQEKVSVTEHTPGRNDFVTTWWKNENVWCMSKGVEENAIHTVRTRTDTAEGEWTLLTEIRMGEDGRAISSLMESYQATPQGDLLMSRTEGYGSPHARTATYEYSGDGILTREKRPDGSQINYEQDSLGRETLVARPYGGFAEQRVITTYADNKFNDHDPAEVTTMLRQKNKADVQMSKTVYSYTEADHVRRVEATTMAMGGTGPRTTITETWLASAPNPYARGRLNMSQGTDGIQTVYRYEPCGQYGAAYTVTQETQIEGKPVAGQSRRMVSCISSEGNTVRTEEYVLLTDGTWAMLDSADYQFDAQNRWTTKTRGNGRTTKRELMCDGRPLWERDEDGITTSYGYDNARRLIETIRSSVMDGANVITPETITSYTRDALGRVVEQRTDTGAMSTVAKTAYDSLGRISSTTDELGRVTGYAYSDDGLTETSILPSGATLATTANTDGSIAHQHGTGQRELHHARDYTNNRIRETVTLSDQQTILSQNLSNGYGETVTTTSPTTWEGSYIYQRSTWNAKGQLTQQGVDNMAPMLYEYDRFGNLSKETWKLAANPTLSNSRITTYAYGLEQREDGVYRIVTATKNNGKGTTCQEKTAELISHLSPVLESKTVSTDARGNESSSWTEYGTGTERLQKSTVPFSTLIATATVIDGITVTQTDHTGITTSQTCAYTVTGITYTTTDGRGNLTSTRTDIAGRTVSVTDAAGNTTTTEYCTCCDAPVTVTDALGNTACWRYDIRGRKTAQWGTGIQPACFGYDEADRMISLTTYRATESDISTDPTGRTDGDTTTWTYHDATGLELTKTYADGSSTTRTYDALNNPSTRTDARGITTTCGYEQARGLLLSETYSDGTTGRHYTWNNVGNLTGVTDGSGTRNITYNIYNEQETDTLAGDGKNHQITEHDDALGRSTGYTYAKQDNIQQTVFTGYDAFGRLAEAGFVHAEDRKTFAYSWLEGTYLLQTLTKPNGMTFGIAYETKRELPGSISYKRGTTEVVRRSYSYDALGRPLTRSTARLGRVENDSFSYNGKSELTGTQLIAGAYDYAYDNIGNRTTAQELEQQLTYETNALNQYTAITQSAETAFEPQLDADGNQTLLKTDTGIWTVAYDANSRPVTFTSQDGSTVVTCGYDYMGRRFMKQIAVNGETTLHHRYIYRGYLQIACVDLTRSAHPCLWLVTWDPSEPTATRPLALQKDGAWYTYGLDLTKNVWELFTNGGQIRNHYSYTPFGGVKAAGPTTQPIRWSSEHYDEELALVYYNYRHYNPADGRWINRDPIAEQGGWNLYAFVNNSPCMFNDTFGLAKREDKPLCCKCNKSKLTDSQYCEKDQVKTRQKKTITIYYGHSNLDLKKLARKDKRSIQIGMVTCFANSTLNETVAEESRRLQSNRTYGDVALPKVKANEALDQEIESANKAIKDICKKQVGQIAEVGITIHATDEDGKFWLNKKYPNTGYIKRLKNVACGKPTCEQQGGIMQ